ncbi:hypothetical protein [Carboxydocella sp. ULO1]|uniref:LuxE/PaaK family acyltransferase n=1 Tax=Carboxydocella sp. ULO1 TaxID=1926599 RepID=UPI0009AE7E1B|nr:hypothetical protein [Carboxydocella sp. ULO1]GAW29959.1 B12-binding domain-containing radical SAM protein [Carboxydocella sp. ULO1]
MELTKWAEELDAKVAAFIARSWEQETNEAEFNALALEIFAYQFEANDYYRNLCEQLGKYPGQISHWSQIPAIPTQAFKESVVASIPVEKSELALLTSGTSDPNLRGKIFRDRSSLANIIQANALLTKKYCFPDRDKMTMAMLIPPPEQAPGMAMAFGLAQLLKNYGKEDSQYFISERGLDAEGLLAFLTNVIQRQEPVALVGATSGFVLFFNHIRKQGKKLVLPEGSRVLDGGGYQGTFGAMTREEFYQNCQELLGISAHFCVNVLGMSESGTNYVDNVLAEAMAGRLHTERQKITPPWTRTVVVGMRTGQPLPPGEIGLIRHFDLTNRATVLAVQTDNLGYLTAEGFEIIGRAEQVTSVKDIALGLGHRCSTVVDRILAHSHACSTVMDRILKKAGV